MDQLENDLSPIASVGAATLQPLHDQATERIRKTALGSVDPERTIILLMQYGGLSEKGEMVRVFPKRSTRRWLEATFPAENLRGVCAVDVIVARNRSIRDEVLPHADKFDWLVSLDHDIAVTHPGVLNFFAKPWDVVCCECDIRGIPKLWADPQAFHTGFWRCRVEVLQAIEPPWFAYPRSADGCELLGCSCSYFRGKAIGAGFSVGHGGWCAHDNRTSTCWGTVPGAVPLSKLQQAAGRRRQHHPKRQVGFPTLRLR